MVPATGLAGMRGLIEPHSFEPKEIQWAQTFVCSADVSLAPKIIAALHSVGMKSTFKNHSTVKDLSSDGGE
jgi:hypothetical protein